MASANLAALGGKRSLRVVVIGDAGTGKSSLVVSAATDGFPEDVPRVMPPTRLPDDYFANRVPITIVDTSSSPEQNPNLITKCQSADAVVLTYACDRPETLNHLGSFWLPELRRLESKAPVIVVGCKLDLRDEEQDSLEAMMAPIMEKFQEIETCIECSALRQFQVREVLYFAQMAVIYPTAPLLDQNAQILTTRCRRALKRIFILCDHDRDEALSDVELNDFQVKCFNAPLQPAEIASVTMAIKEKLAEGVNDNGLTLSGFLFFHNLLIRNGQLETPWTVLRKFGYDNELKLRDDLLPAIKRAPDQTLELTSKAIDFLRGIFNMFDTDNVLARCHPATARCRCGCELSWWRRSYLVAVWSRAVVVWSSVGFEAEGGFVSFVVDRVFPIFVDLLPFLVGSSISLVKAAGKIHRRLRFLKQRRPIPCLLGRIRRGGRRDGALLPAEIEDLFSTAPENPWSSHLYMNCAETNVLGGLSFEGFISKWSLMTLLHPSNSFANLIYVGYSGNFGSAFTTMRKRRVDRKKQQTQRNVFHCYVIGSEGAGKTAFLQSFVKRQPYDALPVNGERFAANIVKLADGTRKTLVMQEITEGDIESLLSDRESLAPCDVALFVYDSCDEFSWQRTKDLLVKVVAHGKTTGFEVPCLIVAAKDDLDRSSLALQDSTRVSHDMGIETPIPISARVNDLNNIFCRIVHAAQQPHLSIPETEAGRTRRQYRQFLNRSLKVVSVGAAVTVVGIAAYRVYAARKNASS
uniref:Miro domain-containing protein n=1 Tax=Leersia perrieri TaxID=77586 RepID=A0A0D9V7P4_9ORYZ